MGVSRRKARRTTIRDERARPAPDRADITSIATGTGFLHLAVVLDAWSRRIVGWAMATYLRTELVLSALEMALTQRRPEAVIHHAARSPGLPEPG